MGSSSSKPAPKYKYINTGEGKLESKPENLEFEKRWDAFIRSLDVDPENVRQIEQLEQEQKELLLLNFESKNPKCSAAHYVSLIKALQTKKTLTKSFRQKSDDDPVHVLSAIEVSLRTNNVEWVYDFLNNHGLEVLLDYMSKTLVLFLNLNYKSIKVKSSANVQSETKSQKSSSSLLESKNIHGHHRMTTLQRKTSALSRFNKSNISVNESVKNSLHQGLKCMRAILNNQRGCEMAFEHSRAIDVIALCLLHPHFQTKTLVLETLAAICLIVNGLQKVLGAFDYFKEITGESRRFDTLITYFRDHETFKVDDYNIDFMVSCTQFINIVVHSGEDINLRVYLQQEFSLLGLDEFYKKLEERSGDRLKKQVEAYNGNRVDVSILLEDSDAKENLSLEVERLEQELYTVEGGYQNRLVQLENKVNEIMQMNDILKAEKEEQQNEYLTLKQKLVDPQMFSDRENELRNQINTLQNVLKEKNIPFELSTDIANMLKPQISPIPPPPPPPNAPPPPGAPPGIAPPPPPPGQPPGLTKLGTGATNTQTQSIRPPIQTKYKLPMFNWTVLKNQQLKGTVFVSMNDEVLYDRLEFDKFEYIFKLNSVGDTLSNGLDHNNSHSDRNNKKKPEKKTLLDANKHRCLGVLLRFLDQEKLNIDSLCKSINQLEVSVEVADRILYQLPTNDDIKTYRKYEYTDKLPINLLTDEDRLLITLCKMERLQQKLEVVVYIQNFTETYTNLVEKVMVVTRASLAVRSSQKLKQILEIILAYGNLMNSSRRGIMYGFRLESLNLLTDTKSVDKSWTLMQFFVDVVESKFPNLIGFCDELKFLEQASKIPMEAITSDVMSLTNGMKQVRDELSSNSTKPPRLKKFFTENDQLTAELSKNAQNAKETFLQAAEWFGERQNNPTPDAFFGIFYRFTESFKKSLEEITKKRAQLMLSVKLANEETPKHKIKDNLTHEELQKKLAQEARKKNRRLINRTRQINGDGIMDEILAGLEKPLEVGIHQKRTNTRFQEEVF